MLRGVLVVAALVGVALAFPGGPPTDACSSISPNPTRHRAEAQEGNGGYMVYTDLMVNEAMGAYRYTAGGVYNMTVVNEDDTIQLRGFMVQARDPSGELIGEFTPTGDMQALVNCPGNPEATIGHVNGGRIDFLPEMFTWTAPSGDDGYVNFRFAVVRTLMVYYADQDAAAVAIGPTGTTSSAPATTYAGMLLALFSAVSVWCTL